MEAFLSILFVLSCMYFMPMLGQNNPYFFLKPCKFRKEDVAILSEELPFYKLMRHTNRMRFLKRLCRVMRVIELSEKKGVQLNRQDRVLLAAPAIMMTWGFNQMHVGAFRRIFVYPTKYYNRFTRNFHHGETSPQGVIVVAWDQVQRGYAIDDDARHLLYHEYAHALVISRFDGKSWEDFVFQNRYNRLVRKHFKGSEAKYGHFLRAYAFTNHMEFFAVVCEWYFEQPKELKMHAPDLYLALCKLFKFDILKLN